jgi:hypothetical protein
MGSPDAGKTGHPPAPHLLGGQTCPDLHVHMLTLENQIQKVSRDKSG